jgi:hypothetical protein
MWDGAAPCCWPAGEPWEYRACFPGLWASSQQSPSLALPGAAAGGHTWDPAFAMGCDSGTSRAGAPACSSGRCRLTAPCCLLQEVTPAAPRALRRLPTCLPAEAHRARELHPRLCALCRHDGLYLQVLPGRGDGAAVLDPAPQDSAPRQDGGAGEPGRSTVGGLGGLQRCVTWLDTHALLGFV